MLEFKKFQGTGNDFIIINDIENKLKYSFPIFAKYICDRHYGVGADGVIFIYKSLVADFKMRIFNKDGSEAEMCGNGIRCVAKYLFEENMIDKTQFEIETLAGIKNVELNIEGKKVISVRVNLGKPRNYSGKYIINIENNEYQLYPVNVGNQHAVCFVKNIYEINLEKVGPVIENYKYFINKTNVEFVQIINDQNIKVRVWERGVGETNSCGTGAVASMIVAYNNGYVKEIVNVELNGGKLEVKYNLKNKDIYLIGPAEYVFKGKFDML